VCFTAYSFLLLNSAISIGDSEGDDKPVKDSLAYIQLEKQNERLKEALIKWAFSYRSS
jgi:hypothetical protein